MKALKKLSSEDLDNISNFLSVEINKELGKIFDPKEIIDEEVNIEVRYGNDELDIDSNVNVETDGLRDIDNDIIKEAVDRAYAKLDNYIESNFKEDKVE